jgi:protein-tyrosine phosphatase
MHEDRHLDWEGCFNVRDLGGLPAAGGRRTRRGAVVRADAVDRLTAVGWAALQAHGVRTIIDLRNDDELGIDVAPRPAGLSTMHLPLDGVEDTEFWDVWATGPQFGTPLYYRPHLDRFPDRAARVVAAVARAESGGVLVHCVGGRDRTGMISMMLLALAGVVADDIAEDYALSAGRLSALYRHRGEPDQGPMLEAFLTSKGTSARAVIRATLASLDVEAHLGAAGVTGEEIAAVRARLLEGPSDPG